jgi:hypothetical protein
MHVCKRPDFVVLAMRIKGVADPARRTVFQTRNGKYLILVIRPQGIGVCSVNFLSVFDVTGFRALNFCLAGMGNFHYFGMAFLAVNLTVRGRKMLFFVYMKHLEVTGLFQPHKAGILVACEAASLVNSKTDVG